MRVLTKQYEKKKEEEEENFDPRLENLSKQVILPTINNNVIYAIANL